MVAANRDEFLARQTARLAFLDRDRTLLAGRDLQGGGTWLGITAGLRFAAITNYREPAATRADAPTRGGILLNYLTGAMPAGQYLQDLTATAARYNGFNLILGDARDLYYYSSKINSPQLLSPGFYGLSNHLLDTPWPKVVRGKELLRPQMVDTDHIDPIPLFERLADNQRPPDHQLPDTGVGQEWERLLGTIFIDGATYGTRSSAVITVTEAGAIEFTEKTLHRSGGGHMRAELVRLTLNKVSRGQN